MKICWDSLENLRYSKKTQMWYKKTGSYIYMDSCKECGESYLTFSIRPSNFCSKKCVNKGKNNPMYEKNHSEQSRKKISEAKTGKNHPNWKGGVSKKNIPLYDTYAYQIEYAEEVRRCSDDENILEVKCAYCGKWYIPILNDIWSRIRALNGNLSGESRLYCSNECKKECPIFWQYKFPKDYKKASSREIQPELRQMVFERDYYTCQKCGSEKNLHCHHITGVELNPIESADMDNCITLCKDCHKEVHKQDGCNRSDYKRKKCLEEI